MDVNPVKLHLSITPTSSHTHHTQIDIKSSYMYRYMVGIL